MKKLLIGTQNSAKNKAIQSYLIGTPWTLVSLAELGITEDVAETGSTYEENATLKALTYARLSGLPTIADDSGLEIAALNNAPGIYSSRFAGENKSDEEKVAYLLERIKEVPEGHRSARFVSVVAYALPTGEVTLFRGESYGSLALTSRGTWRKGFPYYALYIPEGYTQTVNELLDNGLSYRSHRTISMEKFITHQVPPNQDQHR